MTLFSLFSHPPDYCLYKYLSCAACDQPAEWLITEIQ